MTVAELTRHTHGPEVWAERDGTCKPCGKPIAKGDVIVVVDNLGACHALCGTSYCRTIEEHLEDLEDQPEEAVAVRTEISDAVSALQAAGVPVEEICDDLESQLDRLKGAA